MLTTTYRLGGPQARDDRRDELRDGALAFVSPRGLRPAQRLLIQALPKHSPGRVLAGMETEGVTALAARALWPDSEITWFHLDAYVERKVGRVFAHNEVDDVTSVLTADVPPGPFDLVALAFAEGSEAQLMWDLLEGAHDALRVGGRLVVSTAGRPDGLRVAVQRVFRNVTPAVFGRRKGGAFLAERRREKQVLKDRSHAVRAVIRHGDDDEATTLDLVTRPGTFAYRRMDPGTRALAEWLHPGTADTVLDLGAGCGALGLYAALRLPAARVVLVDSNIRAVECARQNAESLGVADRVEALVRADLEDLPDVGPRGYALALANPPYYGGWRVAESFMRMARKVLRGGGRFAMVAKDGTGLETLTEIVEKQFGGGAIERLRGYAVVYARAPGGDAA